MNGLGYLAFSTFLFAAAGSAVAQRPARHIVIPSDAAPPIKLAADELQRCLSRMTGGTYAVSSPDNSLDPGELEMRLDSNLPTDGYRMGSNAGRYTIAGGSPRGCLYGTYAFLHEQGCRWPLPGGANEVLPRLEQLKRVAAESTPAVRRRGMVYCIEDPNDRTCVELVEFLARNGFSYLFLHVGTLSPETRSQLADALKKRDMGFEFGGHLLPSMLPRELFKEHPEYFRMENGQRTDKLNMCPSSDEAAAVMARNAQAKLDELKKDFPRLETLHLWPDDLFNGGWCSCPKCAALSDSDQSLLVLNQIAARMQLGETMLGHCAYHACITPPTKIKAHPRVRLMYAPRERSYLHPLDGCKGNQWYLEQLQGLVKAAPNEPEVFEYYHDMILFRYLPMPLPKTIGADVAVYRKAGIDGIGSLSFHGYDRWAYGPNSYVLGRALWRGQGRPDDLTEYCRAVYGPQAESMARYFEMLSELCSTAMDTCEYTGFIDLRVLPPNQPGLEAHRVKLDALTEDGHLDKIEQQLKLAMRETQEPYRGRIAEQWPLWQFARQETQTLYKGIKAVPIIEKALKDGSTPDERREAIKRVEAILRGIEAGCDLILSSPSQLRGSFAQPQNSAFLERKTSYQHAQKTWLQQLQAKSK